MTVADVLELAPLQSTSLVAGDAGLHRQVTGVNIIEVPDVWLWLKGGEFLLTAAYAWRDNPARLVDVLHKLDRVGVAALGFKLGQYVRDLPPEVLRTANELKLPLVVLPASVAYRDVFEPLYEVLFSHGPALSSDTDRHQTLLRFGLDDQSIEKIAGALARKVGREVRVFHWLDDVMYVAPPDGVVMKRAMDDAGREACALLDALSSQQLTRRARWVDHPGGSVLASALIVGGRRHGCIVVSGPPNGDDLLTDHDVVHAAELISFLVLKRLAFLEGRQEASRTFLESLMSDSLSNEEAVERALTLGLRLTRPCTVIVAGVVGQPLALTPDDWHTLRHRMERALRPAPCVISADPHNGRVYGMVQTSESDEITLELLLSRLASVDMSTGTPVIAVGTAQAGLDGVRHSRAEALITYEAAKRLDRGGIVRFADLGVERILSQVPSSLESHGYVESVLGTIRNDSAMLATLEAFLSTGGNKSATAVALHLHRSSLTYRLEKIEKLLNVDLSSPERRHELWLALRLSRVLDFSQAPTA